MLNMGSVNWPGRLTYSTQYVHKNIHLIYFYSFIFSCISYYIHFLSESDFLYIRYHSISFNNYMVKINIVINVVKKDATNSAGLTIIPQ